MVNATPVILVCDDSPVDRLLIRRLLEQNSVRRIVDCADGEAALRLIREKEVDLVVTDLAMPERDGLSLVREIKRNWSNLPVVLVTGAGSEKAAVEALRAGAASYSPKSALAMDLPRTVDFVLDIASRTKASALHGPSGEASPLSSGFVLDNDCRLIGPLVEHLQHCLPEWSESDRLQIGMAVAEALSNAMHHGNLEVSSDLRKDDDTEYHHRIRERRSVAPWNTRRVHVRTILAPEEFRIQVRDDGPGFDQSSIPDPTSPENLTRLCGRGLFLIRSFMDHVQYNESGNEVEMVKRRPS